MSQPKVIELATLLQSMVDDGSVSKQSLDYSYRLAELASMHDRLDVAEREGDTVKFKAVYAEAELLYHAARKHASRHGLEAPNKALASMGYTRYSR